MQQISSISTIAEPEPVTDKNHYLGILITEKELKRHLFDSLAKYGIEDQYEMAEAVVFCESSWQINPKPNGISWGISQFTKPTWQDFGRGDIMNPLTQLDVMAKMWSKNLQGRWDCYKIVL